MFGWCPAVPPYWADYYNSYPRLLYSNTVNGLGQCSAVTAKLVVKETLRHTLRHTLPSLGQHGLRNVVKIIHVAKIYVSDMELLNTSKLPKAYRYEGHISLLVVSAHFIALTSSGI